MQAFWSAFRLESKAITLSGASLGTAAGLTATGRLTIARIRGTAFAHLDAGAVLDAALCGVGIIVVKEEAFTIGGVTAMPGPLTDIEQAWIWHHMFTLGPAVVAADDGSDISRNDRVVIDSKAQRKMQAGDTLAFVFEVAVIAGSPSVDVYAAARVMALLP